MERLAGEAVAALTSAEAHAPVVRPAPTPAPALPNGLTVREADVLRLLTAGYSNKQIAERFVVSVATVRGHTISIYGKIGTAGRAAAATFALRHGILPPDDP